MLQVLCKIERNTLKLEGSCEMAAIIASSPSKTSAGPVHPCINKLWYWKIKFEQTIFFWIFKKKEQESSSFLSSASRAFKQVLASSREESLREVGNGKFATWMRSNNNE